jgi:hypothetical protein
MANGSNNMQADCMGHDSRHKWVATPTNGKRPEELTNQACRRKKEIMHGESWGQRDPIRGEWTVQPNNSAAQVCMVEWLTTPRSKHF